MNDQTLRRMIIELENLVDNITRINVFLKLYDADITDAEIYLLRKQKKAMVEYKNALTKRINFYKENKK